MNDTVLDQSYKMRCQPDGPLIYYTGYSGVIIQRNIQFMLQYAVGNRKEGTYEPESNQSI